MNENETSDFQLLKEQSAATNQIDKSQTETIAGERTLPPETERDEVNNRSMVIFFIVGLVTIVFDQLSKWYIEQNIPINDSQTPIEALYPYFQFSHVANTGVSFGLFSGINTPMIIVASVAAIAVVYYAWNSPPESKIFYLALGLVLGGIVGNLIDRIRLGHVTDFVNINLRPLLDIPIADWYIFNIADLALVSGVVILFVLSFVEVRQSKQNKPAPDKITKPPI